MKFKKLFGLLSVFVVAGTTALVFLESDKINLPNINHTFESGNAAKLSESTNESEKSQESRENPYPDLPKIAADDWRMLLVSPDHKLAKDIASDQLTSIDYSHQIDKRVLPDYQKLAEAAQKAGISLQLISSYRSVAQQEVVFAERKNQLMGQGMTEEEAIAKTKETMTEPGYSEHHTGLAVDVVDQAWLNSNPSLILDASYSNTEGAKWLQANSAKYGFIVRYPDGKENITKITYEPWHLRYVGKESAQYIVKHQLTFEEYVERIKEWGSNGN